MEQIRRRLTYANVMSSIAVFLVLGGATALAAGLAKNSVGSKQIKKNAVTSAKIKKNAVTTAKIKNGAVTGAKVNAGTLGTVPNATHADSANTATTSNTTSGIGTLPSGKSESGFFATAGEGQYIADGVTFQQPLAASIPQGNVEWLRAEETSSSCPGRGRAAPNHLCLYDNEESEIDLCCIYDFAFNDPAADRNEFIAYWEPLGSGAYVSGEWTVTAPGAEFRPSGRRAGARGCLQPRPRRALPSGSESRPQRGEGNCRDPVSHR